MLTPTTPDLLAAERQSAFLLEAERARLTRQARDARRGDSRGVTWVWAARIRRAAVVRIRPVRPGDTVRLHLGPDELRHVAAVDHHDREALVAVRRLSGRTLGVARYVRRAADREAADVAVTVVDDWQGRGLGTELVARLSARARCEGLHRFIASVPADNVGVRRLLETLPLKVAHVSHDGAASDYEITLTPTAAERRALRWWVLGSAEGPCAGT